MGRKTQPELRRDSDAATTLGDLLFGKKPKPYVAEGEWSELVRRVSKEDELALHALYSRMHRLVFTVMLRMTHNRETAEELTVDVFHEVWRRASSYDPAGGSVIAWIMTMARSRAIDRLRFEQRKKRAAIATELVNQPVAGDDPGELIAAKQQNRLVRQALNALTPEERRAIETAFFSELTYSETATRLDEPVGTVKARIRTGLAKLRRALAGRAPSSP
jgi:RNA polymerase sigma-70 factor (ECF subfamily)